jgi:hypothetical protein
MDLMRLVTELSPAHLRAVARRPSLGETVTDLLVLRGRPRAVTLALLNRNARFSQTSLTTLAERAGADGSLRTALVQRSDLPDPIVERLWPLLDAGHKARLLASGWRYSMGEIEEVGRETGAALLAAVRDGTLPQGVDTYRSLVEEGRVSLSEALDEVVGAGRLVEAAQLVARLTAHREEWRSISSTASTTGASPSSPGARGLDEAVLTGLACARARLPFIGGSDVRRTLKAREETTPEEAAEVLDLLDTLWWAGVSNGGTRRRFKGLTRRIIPAASWNAASPRSEAGHGGRRGGDRTAGPAPAPEPALAAPRGRGARAGLVPHPVSGDLRHRGPAPSSAMTWRRASPGCNGSWWPTPWPSRSCCSPAARSPTASAPGGPASSGYGTFAAASLACAAARRSAC